MVAFWLVHFVSPSIRQSIIWMDNTYDIRTDLKHRYSQGDLPCIFELQMDVPSLCQGDLIVSEYFTKLRVIWDELSNFILEPVFRASPNVLGTSLPFLLNESMKIRSYSSFMV